MQNKLKCSILVFLALPMVGPLHAGDQNARPDAEPLSRYQAMIEHSPFALATETALPPPAPENVGFTKDLLLTGAVRLKGSEYITIESKDHNQRFSLKNGETYNEISLVSVAWSDVIGKTKATLKRGAEFGTIGFDEAAARTGAVTPQPGNGGPGGPNSPPPGSAPGGTQQPQPPGVVAQPQPTTKGPGQNPMIVRRGKPIPSTPVQ